MAENKSGSLSRKHWYLELLRILGCFWVIYNHTGEYGWEYWRKVEGIHQFFGLMFSCMCTVAVPVFLMISGAVLLGKNEDLKVIYRKRVWRMVLLIVVVSCCNWLYIRHSFGKGEHLNNFLSRSIMSFDFCTYYLWLYVGFLIMLPVLRIIAQKKELTIYLTGVYVVLSVVFPYIQRWSNIAPINLYNYTEFFTIQYIYPLLGHYIHSMDEEELSKKRVCIIAVVTIMSIWIHMDMKHSQVEINGKHLDLSFSLFHAVFLFYLTKYIDVKNRIPYTVKKMILLLGPTTLGAFLISSLLIWRVFPLYLVLQHEIHSLIACMIWTLVTMLLSMLITIGLRMIPFIKRYL